MQAIREIRDIVSQKLIVNLPRAFLRKRAEIIILSIEDGQIDANSHHTETFEQELETISWEMGSKFYTSREQLYER